MSGDSFFGDIKEGFKNPLVGVGNLLLQAGTGGTIGLGKDGIKAGITGQAAIDGVKEVTGAAAAEEANALARDQFEQNQQAALDDRQNAITQNNRRQVAASNAAGSARSNSNQGGTSGSQKIGNVSDFLGL